MRNCEWERRNCSVLNEDEENNGREIGSGKGNVERSSVEESMESWLVRGRLFVKRSAKMLEDILSRGVKLTIVRDLLSLSTSTSETCRS